MIRRAGRKTVTFANHFAGFLQAYSGIVEIMQGVDQQNGGVAYAALSSLFIVAINKQRKEEKIDATLLTLQKEFSRIEILQDIHFSPIMMTHIDHAYRLGIEFAEEAEYYYSRSSYRRVLEAFTKPPSLGIDTKISEITNVMVEIDKERATLDSQRLLVVQQNVDDIRETVEGTQVELAKERLGILKMKLLVDQICPRGMPATYGALIHEAFKNPGRLKNLSIDRITQDDTFRHWENARGSSMMLLHGTTAITKGDFSWLSPLVLHLIERYQDQRKLVFFHFCHDRTFMEPDTPLQDVLSSIIYQVLAARPSMLLDVSLYQELMSQSSDPNWHSISPEIILDSLIKLLDFFPEVYLLIDRVDRIKGSAQSFTQPLVRIVDHCKGRVKIFLVASSNRQGYPEGKMTPEVLESLEEDLGPRRFFRLRLDQR
ncbi:MAG: hypothetical protein Q9170_003689 [Blastenia crenularia]